MGILDILGYVGETLDKPGAAVRGTLAGDPSQLLNLLPFSDTLGITDPSARVSGRDLLEQYNLLAPNTPGLDWGDVGGFFAEEALDPMNWIPGGLVAKQGLKGASRLAEAFGGARRLPSWSDDVEGILPRLAEQEVMDLDTDWALEAKRMNMIPPAHQADQMGTVFEPDDIQGMYDQYLALNPAPAYYSRLDKAAEGLPERFKVDSLQNLLKRAPEGFAKEEWAYRNLPDYTAALKGEVTTRDDLLRFLNENPLDIYPNKVSPQYEHYIAAPDALEGGYDNYRETLMKWNTGRPEADYRSAHFFGEANPLLHVRSTSRPNPLGEGTMKFADEIQSDWHQAGRKQGYGPAMAESSILRSERNGAVTLSTGGEWELDLLPSDRDNGTKVVFPDGGSIWFPSAGQAEEYAREVLIRKFTGVPDAPLKEDWPRLGFKELLRQAIEDNAQAAGWTTGRQIQGKVGGELPGQQAFYDQQMLGIAKKYLKQWGVEPQPFNKPLLSKTAPLLGNPQTWEQRAEEILRDHGVETAAQLPTEALDEWLRLSDPVDEGGPLDDVLEGFGFPITDRMRRDILSRGQPLLSAMPWLAAALGGGAAASRMNQGEPSVY